MNSVLRCRPHDFPVSSLINASTLAREADSDGFIEPAADTKWRYDRYKDTIKVSSSVMDTRDNTALVLLQITNPLDRAFRRRHCTVCCFNRVGGSREPPRADRQTIPRFCRQY